MKRRSGRRLAALAAWIALFAAGAAAEPDWKTLRSAHFVVYYAGESGEAGRVSREAEAAYERLRDGLGLKRLDDSWLWDRRIEVRLYASREQFIVTTGSPAWSAGRASYDDRVISTYHGSRGFLDDVLPHEVAHLVFRNFVGAGTNVPQWLHEGLAQWQDGRARRVSHSLCRALLSLGALPSVAALDALRPAETAKPGMAVVYYGVAASLVSYLIDVRGAERFRRLCRELRDGRDMETALRFTYGAEMGSVTALERAWKKHVEAGL